MKQNIIDNVDQFSSDQLADHISQGNVTLEELIEEAGENFTSKLREEVCFILDNKEDDDWNKQALKKDSIDSYENHLQKYPDGKYSADAKQNIRRLESARKEEEQIKQEDSDWKNLNKNDKKDLCDFKKKHPRGKYYNKASKLYDRMVLESYNSTQPIQRLIQDVKNTKKKVGSSNSDVYQIIKTFINKGYDFKLEFLEHLKSDNNFIDAQIAELLLDEDDGCLTYDELLKIAKIDIDFINALQYGSDADLEPPRNVKELEKINKQSTEIYFWGAPNSGKSCALAAILSAAQMASVATRFSPDPHSQGYAYMTYLTNLFKKNEVFQLVASTAIDEFYEIGFDLIDLNKDIHPITCIDMAGELMRCMYKSNADSSGLTLQEWAMLDTMHNILMNTVGNYRKTHVFVIEYGAENKRYEGLDQNTYLDGALLYMNNPERKEYKRMIEQNTDAIYILVTKIDKVPEKYSKNQKDLREHIKKYIDKYYKNFKNGLDQICEDNSINNGEVDIIGFSIGKVCFEQFCLYDPKPSENVVKIIFNNTACIKGGLWGKILKLFRK